MGRIKGRLTYANVAATVAIFLALGGVSWAVTTLPKNSVGSKQIKKNAVKSKKVKDGSLLSKDFKAGQIPAGKQGPPGAKGDTGAKGATGPSDAYASSATSASIHLAGPFTASVVEQLSLPAGSYVVTGTATIDNADNANTGTASCALITDPQSSFAFGRTGLDKNSTFDDVRVVSMTGAVTLPAQTTVSYACSHSLGDSSNMDASSRYMTAIKVGSLHGQ